MFGTRAAQAVATEPNVRRLSRVPQWRFAPPTAQTRGAMWRLAGPRREAPELEQLLDDPYPLARLIARAPPSTGRSPVGRTSAPTFRTATPQLTAFT